MLGEIRLSQFEHLLRRAACSKLLVALSSHTPRWRAVSEHPGLGWRAKTALHAAITRGALLRRAHPAQGRHELELLSRPACASSVARSPVAFVEQPTAEKHGH